MNILGHTDIATAPQWQIDLLLLKTKPKTTEQIEWFEKNGANNLFDSTKEIRISRGEREFCPPTFVAMSEPKD